MASAMTSTCSACFLRRFLSFGKNKSFPNPKIRRYVSPELFITKTSHRYLHQLHQHNSTTSESYKFLSILKQQKSHVFRTKANFVIWSRHSSSNAQVVDNISKSATNANVDEGLVYFTIPEPPQVPAESLPESAQEIVLNALGEPSLSSLGLASWTPVGRVQWIIETIHVAGDLPWWSSIVICTVILRICLFPLIVKLRRNAVHMSIHSPKLADYQQKISKARRQGNDMESASITMDMMEWMKENKVNPLKNMLMPLIQTPFFICMFVALRRMSLLPVETLRSGGTLWFSDLTIPDPYYVLPVLTCATLLTVIEIGSDTGVKMQSMGNVKFFMRALPVVFFPFTLFFPSSVLCYWFTNNAMSLLQTALLKLPVVRRSLSIPDMVPVPQFRRAGGVGSGGQGGRGIGGQMIQGFRDSFANAKNLSAVKNRAAMDRKLFQEAGMGPIQKTYAYDPTKVTAAAAASVKGTPGTADKGSKRPAVIKLKSRKS